MCVYVYLRACVCVYVRVCVYVYVCVCMFVRVCECEFPSSWNRCPTRQSEGEPLTGSRRAEERRQRAAPRPDGVPGPGGGSPGRGSYHGGGAGDPLDGGAGRGAADGVEDVQRVREDAFHPVFHRTDLGGDGTERNRSGHAAPVLTTVYRWVQE